MVSIFISNHHWNIPQNVIDYFPNISSIFHQVVLHIKDKEDCMVWTTSEAGDLSLKEEYFFKYKNINQLNWTRFVWSKDMPPARSFVSWILMHNKLPIDENLKLRGCFMPSICNQCWLKDDSIFHLFF